MGGCGWIIGSQFGDGGCGNGDGRVGFERKKAAWRCKSGRGDRGDRGMVGWGVSDGDKGDGGFRWHWGRPQEVGVETGGWSNCGVLVHHGTSWSAGML